jgi:hypothetical protein
LDFNRTLSWNFKRVFRGFIERLFLLQKLRRQSKTMVMSSIFFAQRYVDGRSYLAPLPAAVQHHERHVEPPGPLAQAALNPRKASSEEGRKSSDLMCSLRHILPSSPTTSFSLLWRGVSLLYETRTTPGRVLNSRAVHQGQPRMKRGLCLALVDALELLSAVDWNILVFQPKCRIRILKSKH